MEAPNVSTASPLQQETAAAAEKLTDALESIVTLVEARQEARAAQLDAAAGGDAPKFQAAKHVETLGGPLTSLDLSRLSLLCTEISNSSGIGGFEQVDPELLLNLATMLETHVNAAASVDLIREVHRLLQNDGSKSKRSSSAMVEEVCVRQLGLLAASLSV